MSKSSRILLAVLGFAAFAGIAIAADQLHDQLITDNSGSSGLERQRAFDTSDYTAVTRVFFNYLGAQSFIRFENTSGASSNFDVKVMGGESGTDMAPNQTYRITVPDKGSVQRSISDIRTAILAQGGPDITPTSGDTFLNLYVHSDASGPKVGFQHVTFNGNTGFFENVGVCTYDPTQDYSGHNQRLINVHTSALAGYPSKIEINNPESVARAVKGTVYDAVTGTSLGSFTVNPAANSTLVMDEATIEQQINFKPTSSQQHINIEFDTADSSPYTALVGHKVTQTSSGAVFNLSEYCPINPKRTFTSGSSGCSSTPTSPANPSGTTSGSGSGSSSGSGSTSCTCTSANPSGGGSSSGGSCAPVANDDTLTDSFIIGQQATISVATLTANDSNASGATIDATTAFVDSGTTTANGTYSAGPTSISYTPARTGKVTFTYRIKTSSGTSNYATATLTVLAAGSAPVAVADTLTQTFIPSQQQAIQATTLLANDTNATGATLDSVTTFVDVGTNNANGTYTFANGVLLYTPGHNGTVTFTYRLKASNGLFSNYATVTLTVGTQLPVANNDTLTTSFQIGIPTVISFATITSNDSAGVGATLDTVTTFVDQGTNTQNGNFTKDGDGNITYTADHAGTVTFTYKIKNSAGSSNAATVTLTVVGPTGPPVAANDTLTGTFTVYNPNDGSGSAQISLSTLVANDTNASGATFDTGSVTAPVDQGTSNTNGTITVLVDRIFYMPAHAGTVTFTYKIKNSFGTSNAATVTLTVVGPPVANNDTLTGTFTVGQSAVINLSDLTANDTGASGAQFDPASVTTPVNQGTSTPNSTNLTVLVDKIVWTPASAGTVTFTYKIKNSYGTSNAATVTLTVH